MIKKKYVEEKSDEKSWLRYIIKLDYFLDKIDKKKLDGNYTSSAANCFEQILKITPHKTAAEQSRTSHLTNIRVKRARHEKQWRIHKWHSLLDSYTWTGKC